MPRLLRLATRGSRLALAQAGIVAAEVERFCSVEIRLITVETYGDRHRDVPLAGLAGPDGVFTRAIEDELLAHRADLAVHSLKDVPTVTDTRLALAAFPRRADHRDVLVSAQRGGFEALEAGTDVGTSSPRRAAQALAWRRDLQIVPMRGNVDTRLRRLRSGDVGALILAAAGLARLQLLDEQVEMLPVRRFTPAVGQGALAVQCRADDPAALEILARIDDRPTRVAVTAERAFLLAVGGGCRVPVGGFGEVIGDRLRLRGFIANPDGTHAHAETIEGSVQEPEHLGRELAKTLLLRAGSSFLRVVRGA